MIRKYYRKTANYLASVTGLSIAVLAGAANAELPTAMTTAFTSIETDALALVDLAWPVVISLTGAFILFKMFRRAAAKV